MASEEDDEAKDEAAEDDEAEAPAPVALAPPRSST